jgi:hypothetical protein
MARSYVNQGLYLQRETTPGTPATNAMKRYLSLRGELGWSVNKEYFQASGYKMTTGESITTEMGDGTLEVIQDFNGFLPLLAGVFGAPTTTALVATPTPAFEHVFTLDAKAADTLVTFTAMWGDPTLALIATAFAVNSLDIDVSRTSLGLSASPIFRAPETGTALPTTGVTEVPMVPIRSAKYNVFLDNDWSSLGTTKLLALYSANIGFPNKYEPDWVVNSALPSYSELMEVENFEITQGMTVGFDPTAVGLIDDARNGGMKFVRIANEGPDINGTDNYALEIDSAVRFNPGRVTRGPEAASVVVEMDGRVMVDGESGSAVQVRLVNTVATL